MAQPLGRPLVRGPRRREAPPWRAAPLVARQEEDRPQAPRDAPDNAINTAVGEGALRRLHTVHHLEADPEVAPAVKPDGDRDSSLPQDVGGLRLERAADGVHEGPVVADDLTVVEVDRPALGGGKPAAVVPSGVADPVLDLQAGPPLRLDARRRRRATSLGRNDVWPMV